MESYFSETYNNSPQLDAESSTNNRSRYSCPPPFLQSSKKPQNCKSRKTRGIMESRRKLNFLMKFSLNPPLARFEIFPFFAVHFNISLINFIPGGPAGRFVFLLSHHRKAADGTSQGEFHFLEFSECASPRTNGRWRGGVPRCGQIGARAPVKCFKR